MHICARGCTAVGFITIMVDMNNYCENEIVFRNENTNKQCFSCHVQDLYLN